jgi:hypothetical protein
MPSIDLTGVVNLPLLVGVALVIIVFVLGVIALAAGLNRTDRDLTITLRPLLIALTPRSKALRQNEKMYKAAIARLTDLEQGLAAIVDADAPDLERTVQNWLDFVCQGLEMVLSAGNNANFRIAIWTDDESDPPYLKGLAYCGFDRNDPKYAKLPRATTVAGHVVDHKNDHYVPDVSKDAVYRPRTNKPAYKSMYATPLGPDDDPWAVMTIDAPALDGLNEERRELVRRFGSLATVGATIGRRRMAGPAGTIDT